MTAESIIPWHFTMIDNFIKMEHEQVEQMLNECFMEKHDWTFDVDEEVFGDSEERVEAIRTWLSKCTHMQMTAACCIGNAYHSINIAYVLAALLETIRAKHFVSSLRRLRQSSRIMISTMILTASWVCLILSNFIMESTMMKTEQ